MKPMRERLSPSRLDDLPAPSRPTTPVSSPDRGQPAEIVDRSTLAAVLPHPALRWWLAPCAPWPFAGGRSKP